MMTFNDLPDKVRDYYDRNVTMSVAFVKKDGSVRHMAFRRNLNAYIRSDKEKTEKQSNMLQNNNLMIAYDTNVFIKLKRETGDAASAAKGSYRNFRLDNVLAFLCGGELFDMRQENQIAQRFGENVSSQLTKSMVNSLRNDEQQGEKELNEIMAEMVHEQNIRKMIRSILMETPLNRRTVKVTFDNGDTITTAINGTEDEINDYYLDKWFNVGSGEEDVMAQVTGVEFLD